MTLKCLAEATLEGCSGFFFMPPPFINLFNEMKSNKNTKRSSEGKQDLTKG